MNVSFLCGKETISVDVPGGAVVYESDYPAPRTDASELVLAALRAPIGAPPLRQVLQGRAAGNVVVVVSDVTRPVPYHAFLGALLEEIEAAGVRREEILILVATGMHRPTTAQERREMFGRVAADYRIVDHDATDDASLVELPGKSRAGARVRLNRYYVEAGFRIITGLVEPHFMAGFSGGRKAVCPGLAALETIEHFHGAAFLSSPMARNCNLSGNPLHLEALSVARTAGVDFSVSVVLNERRQVVRAFAGELESAHEAACRFVRDRACPAVQREVDVVLTSSAGHPLDATFYQCVKGFVSCLPAVRRGGIIIAFGGCTEGVGSPEYAGVMKRYAGRWRDFLQDIKKPGVFTKDQWQFQMHARALEKVGRDSLHFVTHGLLQEELSALSVNGHSVPRGKVAAAVQDLLDSVLPDGADLAAFPEGPYCTPV